MRVADGRERDTTTASSFAVTGSVVDLANDGTFGAALASIVSFIVDDVLITLSGLIIGGVDLSNSFDDYSTPYREPVPSLTVA
jgi:large-conductance mechanosensitive channel